MKKNRIFEFTNKPSNFRLFAGLFVFALAIASGLFIWQTSANMQSSINENNAPLSNGEQVKNYEPVTSEPEAVLSPSCSTTTYATTLRFPGGGVTENQLISFNTLTPGTLLSDIPVQGLNAAISEYMADIDFRPATGELYGLIVQNNGATSGTIRIVKVDPATGATTAQGSPLTVNAPGNFAGIDWNPVVDRLRIIKLEAPAGTATTPTPDFNARFNPNDNTFITDTGLVYPTGDTGFGVDEFIIGAAYTNNVVGATQTTLYGLDSRVDRLVRVGSLNGTPNSPNTGLLETVGPLGVNTSGLAELDIATDGIAYAILDTALGTGGFGSPGRFYTVNLTTGAATLVGPIGGLATRFSVGLAVSACPTGPVVTSTGPTITAESCSTPNNAPDPGETLTVTLPLVNNGGGPTTNLTATLQATGGVTNPSAPQNYGVVAANGTPVSRTFTFTVAPGTACGSDITLTFTVSDGATNFANVTRTFTTGTRTNLLSQNFDGVTAPALPTGWTNLVITGTAVNWVTTTTTPSSPPNAAYAPDPATVNAAALVSPAVVINTATAQVTFRNQYNLENTFDGMVLEYTTNGGTTWTDILAGGGTFASGGYNGTISTNASFMSPIVGRMAWTGNSGGYINSVVNLPASLNGQTVQFRWLVGTDNAVAVATGGGWVDDVSVLGARVCNICGPVTTCNIQRRNDFNGDGKTDFSVFRPSNGTWYIQNNGSTTFTGTSFGTSGDKLQPGDYDGDGKTDLGVYRAGTWYWLRSSDNVVQGYQFGAANDIPVIGDYVGDNKADLTVYRPSTGVWYTRDGNNGAFTGVQWGGDATDIPAPGDYNGDCKFDYTVRRTTNQPVAGATQFFILQSGGTTSNSIRWGTDAMQMAIGDYDGDGKSDIGVVDPSGGTFKWYVLSTTGTVLFNGTVFGATNDFVVPGDYDGDGKTDLAYYRPSTGAFAYRNSTNSSTGFTSLGSLGDIPTVRAYQNPLP